jgi:CheY-like chemotaxis protein
VLHDWKRRERIVVVDHDPVLLSLMRDVLEDEGYRVQAFSDPEAAHAAIGELLPDLVLVDLFWSRHSLGWSLIERLLADPRTRRVPLLICTTAIRSQREREHLPAGADWPVLPMPFDIGRLLDEVRASLARCRGDRPDTAATAYAGGR